VVRRNNYKYRNKDYNNDDTRRISVTAASAPSLLNSKETASNYLAERQVGLDSGNVGIVNPRRFAEPALALCILSGKEMTARGASPQHFATRGDLEAFCH
jgi:hypothetical protein